MNTIFEVNLLGLYFLYGLSFYTMGLAIALQYRSYSSFRMAYSLSLLASFGIFHGLSEWGSVFVPLQVPNIGELAAWKLIVIQRLLQAVSHSFLFFFGTKLVSDTFKKNPWWFLLPAFALFLWLLQFARFIYFMESPKALIDWLVISETWSRYLLAFPGGLLTAYGLALQAADVKQLADKSVLRNLYGSVAAFLLFALFSGLVVPQNVGGLSAVLNVYSFQQAVGLPVEVFRTAVAFWITYSITVMLNVFDLEKQRQLDESLAAHAVLKERERFARDLHDDVIQAIYGVGINLQVTSQLVDKDQKEAVSQIKSSMVRINKVITDLRRYIHQLESEEEYDLDALLAESIYEIDKNYPGLKIECRLEPFPGNLLPLVEVPRWQKQVQQVVREALFNIVRHAEATKAVICLKFQANSMEIEISDNGLGFAQETIFPEGNEPLTSLKGGLSNMRARTELLGGTFALHSMPGEGTVVVVSIPLREQRNGTDVIYKGSTFGNMDAPG